MRFADRTEARVPALDEVRGTVTDHVRDAARSRANRKALDALRLSYAIPPSGGAE